MRAHMRRGTWRQFIVIPVVALLACDVPGVHLVRPDGAPVSGDHQGTGFAIHVTLEDSALADSLGWQAGAPGATVVIHRYIDPYLPDTAYTDSAGHAAFTDLLPGWYAVAAYRRLTSDESGLAAGIIRAFGDGQKHVLSGSDSVDLVLHTDQPTSIVLSELFLGGATRDIQYDWAAFFEIHNNSDTTAYVDQMVLGRAYSWVGSADPCEEHRTYRDDPLGIWSMTFHQFPGSGTDYPLAPGQAATIALDAVDHSLVHPSLPDLSHASFELEGTADADNPTVPNLPAPPPSRSNGHGMVMISVAAYFLTLPVDVSDLDTKLIGSYRYARFPAPQILDVLSQDAASPGSQPPFIREEYCTWINREFDTLESLYYRLGTDNRTSIHRRVLREGAAGPVLQDLNTSFVDWVLGVYSPGRTQN